MTEVQGELLTGAVSATLYYPWRWQGKTAAIAYDVRGGGPSLLLLPAFSSISTRAELDKLAQGLAQRYRVITLDWVGFGESARLAWRSRPAIYRALLKDFVQDVVPEVAGLVACGHSAGYALELAAGGEVEGLKAIALVAPTWRGPLPTAMGERRWLYALLRWLVWTPLLGQGLYAVNAHPAFLRWMMGRHVYSDAAFITPDLMQAKHHTTQAPGARFASAAFVTGGLDPVQRRTDWLDLIELVTVPKLAIAGQQTPPKSGAEMEMLKAMVNMQWAIVPGSLAAHEEHPEVVLENLRPFLQEHLGK
ncbi:alpha/beta hydrolase [Nodosilinea sp. LEGE 07298]|uniref:alpha/beta fold hydrolase n=1 Tax=Nodosilinea sp. LEGE 07298 TaxID=2777970 RepID=UPI00187FFDAC|nr:alpha/beta hydrolase [Nodosilinea sp. LEGE 07298]MBE9114093.1 alpha/beta hydrolase [Nodosilinea sp. LEGE 07298]